MPMTFNVAVAQIVSTKQLQQNCRAVNPSDGDTVLQWFEAYADALDRQYYQVTAANHML